MGLLTSDRLKKIINLSIQDNFEHFIESGTYTGRSIIPLAKEFPLKKFYTIEIIEDLWKFAIKKAKEDRINNIEFYLGDTSKILDEVIKTIDGDNFIFFLDAHSSPYEGDSAYSIEKDSTNTVKMNFFEKFLNFFNKKEFYLSTNIKKNKLSEIEVPLLEELKIISEFKKKMTIIIDDFDLFEKKNTFADWSEINIEKVKNIFKGRIKNSFTLPKEGKNGPQLIIEI